MAHRLLYGSRNVGNVRVRSMRPGSQVLGSDALADDALDLLLDEAERALIDVESRPDEPARRVRLETSEPAGVPDLRLAIAELADSYPGAHFELESVGERLRNVGAAAATAELEHRPHLLHLVRLSLEALFRMYPTPEAYEAERREDDFLDEEPLSIAESYETYRQLLGLLRQQLS